MGTTTEYLIDDEDFFRAFAWMMFVALVHFM